MDQNFNGFENQQPNNGSEQENNIQIAQDVYGENEYIQPIYPSSMVTPAKKFNPLAVIIPAAVLLIAGVIIALLLLLPVKNSYRKAEENYFGGLMSALNEAENLTENVEPEKLKVDVSIPLGELTGTDFSEISAEIDAVSRNKDIYSQAKAAFGDKTVFIESWMDRANMKNYFLIPDASDIYAVMELQESKQVSYEEYADAMKQVIDNTAETYFEIIGEPEVLKNQSFEIEGETFTADKSEIHLGTREMAIVFKAFFDNMLENEKTTEILCYMSGCDTKEEFIEYEYEHMNGNFEDAINGSDEYDMSFDMTVYIRNNNVIGREVLLSDSDVDEHFSVGLYQIPAGNSETVYFHYEQYEDEEPDERERLTLLCRDNANGDAHSGSIDARLVRKNSYWDYENDEIKYNLNESTLTAEYSDLALTEENFGGKLTVTADGESGFTANVELKTEGEDKIIKVTVPNICTVTVTSSPSDIEFKDIPVLSEDEYVKIGSGIDSDDGIDYDSETFKKFSEDLERYIDKLMGYEEDYYVTEPDPYVPQKENEDFSVIAGDWIMTDIVFPNDMAEIDEEIKQLLIDELASTVYNFSETGLITVKDVRYDESIWEYYQCRFNGYGDYSFYIEDDPNTAGQYYKENNEIILYSLWTDDLILHLSRQN